VAAALGLALLIQAFLVKPYRIPSESMEPTLDVGERVLVNRVNYRLSEPDRGDVVVFHPPEGAVDGRECGVNRMDDQSCLRPTEERSDTNFIKRIVAIPGDVVSVRGGRAVINGRLQNEPFIKGCSDPATNTRCNMPRPIEVPPGHFFMMGDNRGESDDSRFWGPIPEEWIIGQAFFTYWPIKRVGIL
jgi:signal peptidase I